MMLKQVTGKLAEQGRSEVIPADQNVLCLLHGVF